MYSWCYGHRRGRFGDMDFKGTRHKSTAGIRDEMPQDNAKSEPL